ncbi:PhpK family radical SAM P-methyltransferase [Clostridium felsineum]|uniref:PhpK family radical SAM P-methyltransferase n=1 Tax=Clostridium felsineum TaxID=36839 RepID=UPI00214D9203|nr:PhpK family radical SAM P-methyltransferase [Clostridium felsineum]MCR3759891.1 PhpK family radical SAM P-methyltransferase [Clostridium felsineum]
MERKIDCVFIGNNEIGTYEYEAIIKKMGKKSGAYRDLSLSLVELDGKLYSSMEMLNYLRGKKYKSTVKFEKLKYNELSPAIAYLGTFFEKEGFKFDFINSFQDEKEKLRKVLLEDDIKTIAITTTLYVMMLPILEIVSFIKKYNSKVKIIVGGPFVFNQNQVLDEKSFKTTLETINADFYIINSQGEDALAQLVKCIKTDKDYRKISNIAYKENNMYVINDLFREDNKLDDNMVNWELFDKKVIGEYVSIRTSISCPFSCAFCGFPERAGEYKYIETKVLENNLNRLRNLGTVKVIYFIDDTFNVPKERFKEILRMMIKNKYDFKWNSMFRCQFADRETVELMKQSGCQGVFLGIESASNTILKNMNKRATKEDFRRGMKLLNEYEILTYTSFIIGFPGETLETVNETLEFIKEMKPTFFRTQLWYCDHITPIWKQKEKYEIQGSSFEWRHKTMDSKTACDIIEKIFVEFQGSIWLPQYKFEVPSIYYLLNEGMSIDEIRIFLKEFNSIVAQKISKQGTIDGIKESLNKMEDVCSFNINQNKNNEILLYGNKTEEDIFDFM